MRRNAGPGRRGQGLSRTGAFWGGIYGCDLADALARACLLSLVASQAWAQDPKPGTKAEEGAPRIRSSSFPAGKFQQVDCIVFSRDGTTLASASWAERAVNLWEHRRAPEDAGPGGAHGRRPFGGVQPRRQVPGLRGL